MTDYLLIFDFDGTLANSIDAGLRHANSLAERYHYQAVDDINIIREQSAVNYIYSQIKWYYLPFWARSMKQLLKSSIDEIPLFPGIKELLDKLNTDFQLGIISGNTSDYIDGILERHQADYFSFKIPNNGAKKHRALKRIIRSGNPAEKIIFIGDDLQDIRSAQQVSVKTIAVGWGSTSLSLFEQAR